MSRGSRTLRSWRILAASRTMADNSRAAIDWASCRRGGRAHWAINFGSKGETDFPAAWPLAVTKESFARLAAQSARANHARQDRRTNHPLAQRRRQDPTAAQGNVEADLVEGLQRADGHAEVEHRLLDRLDRRAFQEQVHRLAQVRLQDAIDDKARPILDHQRQAVDRADVVDQGGDRLRRRSAGRE